MTSSGQEKLLEDFYDQLDHDFFISKPFDDEDNLPAVAIAPELSFDDDVIDELELYDADNVVEEPHVPSLPRNQGFSNLDEVTNYKKSDPIPPQEHAAFWYSNKNKSYVVEWETTREEDVHQSGRLPACNVLLKRAGPPWQTSSFETPLDGFSYFMPDSLLLIILENTNKKVQNLRDRFADTADYFYKNKHWKMLTWSNSKHFLDCCICELC